MVLAKKIDLDRILVKISNINTQRQQVLNAVQLQENALKFYIGMPIETNITIPQTEFEVTPQALSEAPNTANRTEYLLLKKQEQLLRISEKSRSKRLITQRFPFRRVTIISVKVHKCLLVQNQSDGVYWSDFSSIGLNLKVPIFTGFGTQSQSKTSGCCVKILKRRS